MKYALLVLLMLFNVSAAEAAGLVRQQYEGRQMVLYLPAHLPEAGSRGLVIVMHGGGGNADRILTGEGEAPLNMNDVAEKNGFIVAYLNGTPAMIIGTSKFFAWNAGGGCCGQAFKNNIDDIGYITGAAQAIAKTYGVDEKRIYGIGHSNGGIMAQRLMCETDLFAAIVPISGPLNIQVNSCPLAKGKRILALHGADDDNVPVDGGVVTKHLSKGTYNSEAYSKAVFTRSGAEYTADIVQGADHKVQHINDKIEETEGVSIAEKAAAFFGLTK